MARRQLDAHPQPALHARRPQDVLTEAYPEEEFWQDLLKVTGGQTNEHLARLVIRESSRCRGWMKRHGVRFQPSLSGTLHLSRTNAFFMGGGKALVNAYYRSAEQLGIGVRYEAPVDRLELDADRFVAAHLVSGERIEARACVVASGGFESNREWLREAWGQNERGEWTADEFLIRGTRFNMGVLLKDLIGQGADAIGDPTQATWWRSTPARRSTTAASAPAWTASRWASWSTARAGASTTRARTSGPSAMPSGAGWSRCSRGRSGIR
jgi:precorrin 3B synthase CobZ